MNNGTKRVYRNPRPQLTIQVTGGAHLGRCYEATYYKVTSKRPLSKKDLRNLRDGGFVGYGQEFMCWYQNSEGNREQVPEELDWRTSKDLVPTCHDVVPCVDVDEVTGEVTKNPSVNPYSGKEDQPINDPYYVYECESRVDSGD